RRLQAPHQNPLQNHPSRLHRRAPSDLLPDDLQRLPPRSEKARRPERLKLIPHERHQLVTLPSTVSEPATKPIAERPSVHLAETALSYILRVGVSISILLVVFGSVLTFIHHDSDYFNHARDIDKVTLVAEPFPHTLGETIDRIQHF